MMADSPKYENIQTEVRLSNRYLGVFMGCYAFAGPVLYLLGRYAPRYQVQQVAGFCVVAIMGTIWLARWVKRMKKKIIFSFNDQLSIQIFDKDPERVIEDYQIAYTDIKSFYLTAGRGGTCIFKIKLYSGKPLKLVLQSYENWGEVTGYKIASEIVTRLKQINPAIA